MQYIELPCPDESNVHTTLFQTKYIPFLLLRLFILLVWDKNTGRLNRPYLLPLIIVYHASTTLSI